MDLRQQRGMELAATRRIRQNAGVFVVPSATGTGSYNVNLDPEAPTCNCPDFETRGQRCKHIWAASYVMEREENPDGSTTVTETLTVVKQRKTYPQNWAVYNEAQTNERDRFQVLLRDICAGLPTPAPKNGRPPLPLSDAIFAIVFKVYSTLSQRRFMSDLRIAHTAGLISRVPHFNSISNYLENASLTAILRSMIEQSSLPLKSVEVNFAVDSSGFSTSRFVRWFDHKYGKERQEHDWVKVHAVCGVKTNIVTAIEIREKTAGDMRLLPPLVSATAKNFRISEVSADKGYSSAENLQHITDLGATPYISFKSNATGMRGGIWEKAFHYFQFNREEFLQHYHRRSNVESTFSMMKRKFGDSLRSKTDVAMVNEVLCKVLCHNLVVLIHETRELGIEPIFWPAQKVTALPNNSVVN